jgi:Ca2+-transporting ATPase
MRRKPRPPRESMLSLRLGARILAQGALIGLTALAAFGIMYAIDPDNVGRARTMAFCVLVYGELLRALAARSGSLPLTRLGFFTNPYLLGAIAISALLQLSVVSMPFARPVFETVRHFGWEWLLMIGLALTPVTIIEIAKHIRARFASSGERGV